MNEIGEFALAMALATTCYGLVSYYMSVKGNRIDLYLSADKTPIIVWAFVTIASVALLRAFFINDFSVEYVWAYSSRELDLFYKISSFWGGQKGSLLFWTWVLTSYMVVAYFQNRHRNLEMFPYAMMVCLSITAFFLVLLNFSTNPFEILPVPGKVSGGGMLALRV